MDQTLLKSLYHYNPDTGEFISRVNRGRVKKGDVSGCKNSNGYLQVMYKGKHYKLHRLAFLYMNGEYPDGDIDHINRDKSDNRWSNLRQATRAQNQANIGVQKNNKLGVRGVHVCRLTGKYKSQICVNGKVKYLGSFDSIDDASNAYKNACTTYFAEYAA